MGGIYFGLDLGWQTPHLTWGKDSNIFSSGQNVLTITATTKQCSRCGQQFQEQPHGILSTDAIYSLGLPLSGVPRLFGLRERDGGLTESC